MFVLLFILLISIAVVISLRRVEVRRQEWRDPRYKWIKR